ncbi:pollen-specific leucine-rich repeat extensin-like protein 4 [Helianthus annuus]|uniref:pollen-specific leucine-rich repeat extensin-like protein 4 n=1 Tax=Helianthus annuus TaxID=4232 RepID=UPI000B8F2885|nr:pollen-specific leucine-rich repeat extensin-like protein 4 [Helianthus annuus]
MASSASSGIYDNHDHMDVPSDDEPMEEIIPSDDEDLDDFQPFALPDHDMVDDVLAVGPQLNPFVIIGHPDGAHIVDYIPLDVVPLAAVPGFIVVSDDEDDIPVIHVHSLDDEIDGGDALDIAILEVSSPIVSVVDLSSSGSSDAASPSAVPVATPAVIPSDTPTPHTTPVTPTTGHPFSPHVADPHHTVASILFTHEIPAPRPGEGTSRQPTSLDTHVPADHRSTRHPPPHMSESDPYHPCHYHAFTIDDEIHSLQLHIQILSRQVWELQQFRDAMPPPPPAYPPPPTPPPPSSPPPPSPPVV